MNRELSSPRPNTPQPHQQPPAEGQPNVPHRSREEHRQHKPDPTTHRTLEAPPPNPTSKAQPKTDRETEGDP